MDIVDHYERMYKEVILPAYKKRLVGPDILELSSSVETVTLSFREVLLAV
jgi:hypothetical protein